MDYAQIIAQERERQGLSQEELAALLSLPVARVQQWESGSSLPNLLQVPFLCAALRLTYENFFGVPPRKGRAHRRQPRAGAYQISYLPVMCNHTIRYYRLRQKMSVVEFALRCNVPVHTVEKWEHGKAIPSLDMVPVICQALRIRLWQFFE
ncbi:MAG: helix-turn-helix domain-containing protein [Clostridia bacterium]|nr:helix-turn-helix domain-containing protein [Clostridia bacterium]